MAGERETVKNLISAGSVFTFPLISPIFAATLHLSISQTSALVSSAILGQYVSAVFWGKVCDKQGPGIVSLFASGLYAIGYGMLGWRYLVSAEMENQGITVSSGSKQWLFLSFYYLLIGCGVSASYFSAIISSTKSLPAKYSGLAIGVPLSVFGLSPLFLSYLASAFTSPNEDGVNEINPGEYLIFLAIFLAIINAISALGLKVVPWEDDEEEISERTPLLTTSDSTTTPLKSSNSQSISEYISQPTFWILGSIMVLATGPCEMTFASLGSIVESLLGVHIANTSRESTALILRQQHVRVISVSNTVSRLAIGALSDYLSYSTTVKALPTTILAASTSPLLSNTSPRQKGVSRLLFVLIACTLLACSFFYVALFMNQSSGLWILSITTGISYGTLFTMAPSIVRTIWCPDDFGRNYGLLSWFSAVGALLFTPLFGVLGDRAAERQNSPICYGRECYESVFLLSWGSCVVAMGLVGVLWIKYWRGKV